MNFKQRIFYIFFLTIILFFSFRDFSDAADPSIILPIQPVAAHDALSTCGNGDLSACCKMYNTSKKDVALYLDSDYALSADLICNSNIHLIGMDGYTINNRGHSLTLNGPVTGSRGMFYGSGSITHHGWVKGTEDMWNTSGTVELNASFEAGAYRVLRGGGCLKIDNAAIPWILTEWLGAKPDDATDCTKAIQDSINALGRAGGVIRFLKGIYRNTGITIKNQIHLIGAGQFTTILRVTDGGNGITIDTSADVGSASIESLTIEAISNNTGTGVYSNGAVAIRDMQIKHFYIDQFLHGIDLQRTINCNFEDGRITGQGITESRGLRLHKTTISPTCCTLSGLYVGEFGYAFDIAGAEHAIYRATVDGIHGKKTVAFSATNGSFILDTFWVDDFDPAPGANQHNLFASMHGYIVLLGDIRCYTHKGKQLEISEEAFWAGLDSTGIDVSLWFTNRRTYITVIQNGVYSLASGIWEKIKFSAIKDDYQGQWASDTFTSELPKAVYMISAHLKLSANAYKGIRIIKNGMDVMAEAWSCSDTPTVTLAKTLKLTRGETIEMWGWHNYGSPLNAIGGGAGTSMTIVEVR